MLGWNRLSSTSLLSRCCISFGSVPYAACAMVGNGFLSRGFHLLDQVVEEKVHEDGVDLGLGVLSLDLPADEFYAPDAASCFWSASITLESGLDRMVTPELQFPVAP